MCTCTCLGGPADGQSQASYLDHLLIACCLQDLVAISNDVYRMEDFDERVLSYLYNKGEDGALAALQRMHDKLLFGLRRQDLGNMSLFLMAVIVYASDGPCH